MAEENIRNVYMILVLKKAFAAKQNFLTLNR